jgi:hypothetical protein
MNKFDSVLDRVIFEIRYGSGHLYFDRCGQCLTDIERQCDGWLVTSVDLQTGKVEQPEKRMHVNFSNTKFDFTFDRSTSTIVDIVDVAKEASLIWKIIQANFALDELIRIGCRFNYILPTVSIDESEKLLEKSKFNITMPEWIDKNEYKTKTREALVILSKADVEYRIRLCGVTRQEAVDPSTLPLADPRVLSKKQNQYRIIKLKKMSEYSANPMYAVLLDVDCVCYNPETISVQEFIQTHVKIVEKAFLPILKNL